MLYELYEFQKKAILPTHLWTKENSLFLNAFFEHESCFGNYIKATNTMLERATRVFEKPQFGLDFFTYQHQGHTLKAKVVEKKILSLPYCDLLSFERFNHEGEAFGKKNPNVLIVAPLSGHFSTLLRDTVHRFLPDYNVYITDWKNARDVPFHHADFMLENYIDYLIEMINYFKGHVHIVAVCQPVVTVLAAVTHLAMVDSVHQPQTMVLMGGPIDARVNPGKVNLFAKRHAIDWFNANIVDIVPMQYEGAGRRICPGYVMLEGFMTLNRERHHDASFKIFQNLVKGDIETAERYQKFYDEYRSVMDIPAGYYLESIERVFQKFELPRGKFSYKGHLLQPKAITKTPLLTIEGGKDDISCLGQTFAAHHLCKGLEESMKHCFIPDDVGHYGIFSGRRFRDFIYPKISQFIQSFD